MSAEMLQPAVLAFKHSKYAVASLTMEEEDLSHLLDVCKRLASQYDIERPLVVITPLERPESHGTTGEGSAASGWHYLLSVSQKTR